MRWVSSLVDKADKLKLFALFCIAATIPLKINIGNVAVILAVILNLLCFEKKNLGKLRSIPALYPIIYFLMILVSTVWSLDFDYGLASMDRYFVPVLLVLILINQDIGANSIKEVLKYFLLSLVLATSVLIGWSLFLLGAGAPQEDVVFYGFTDLFDQHPVYYSLYLSLALFALLLRFPKGHKKQRVFYYFLFAILVIGLVLCASKAILFIDILALAFLSVFKTRGVRRKLAYSLCLICSFIILANISFIRSRFSEGLVVNDNIVSFKPTNSFPDKKQFTYDEKKHISDLDLRLIFLKVGIYHLYKDHQLWFGYGHGDAQGILDYYLYSYNLAPNWYEGFNVHNQYLHLLLYYGVIGLFTFLSYMIYSVVLAIRRRDMIHLIFLAILGFVFCFEVPLLRIKGIVFFFFFNTLFLLNKPHVENSNFRHERDT